MIPTPLFRVKSQTGHLIPVVAAPVPKAFSQPIQVTPPIGRRVPKSSWNPREEPWLPVILGETILDCFERRLGPIAPQPATVVPPVGRRKSEPIEILHGAEAKPVCKPQQVIAAMRPVLPEAIWHATGRPNRVDPPQVGGVADRRAVNRFLLARHGIILINQPYRVSRELALFGRSSQ